MSWPSVVQQCGNWYAQNINEYNQAGWIRCPLPNAGNVRKDCSGFVSCCLRVAGYISSSQCFCSRDFAATSGTLHNLLTKAGFQQYRYSVDLLQPYDIIALAGHVEIYNGYVGGKHTSWGWGSNHNVSRGGLPCKTARLKQYSCFWRLGGAGPLAAPAPYTPTYGTPQQWDNQNAPYAGPIAGAQDANVDQSVFSDAMNNQLSPSTSMGNIGADDENGHRTRIYAATTSKITLDELSIPMNEGSVREDSSTNGNSPAIA